MSQREGEAGPVVVARTVSPTVPNITAPNQAAVALTADPGFIGASAVDVNFAAAPLANLSLLGAFVSNASTGVVSVIFGAVGGNVTTAAQSIRVTRKA